MTKAEQAIVDSYHEKVIALILKKRRAERYSSFKEEERIAAEIDKLEAERRQYELRVTSEINKGKQEGQAGKASTAEKEDGGKRSETDI